MKIFYILLISLATFACSSGKPGEDNILQIEVDVSDLNCWLNLMPGKPGKFHLLGELTIKNKGSEVIEELKLDKIGVFSSKELVYSFPPFFNLKNLNEANSIEPGSSKEFTFGIDTGLKADERLMANNLIDIEMKFICGSEFYQLQLNDIIVEQAY